MRSGTQTVEKALRVLATVASRNTGWLLTDLAHECAFDLATTHRIVKCLAGAGLVYRRPENRHYLAGPELYNLGLAASYHTKFIALARKLADATAAVTSHVGSVFLRSAGDFVCVARAGRTSLKGLTIQIGVRRPLMVSAGGVAMLLALPREQCEAIVAENLARISKQSADKAQEVQRMWVRSQRVGYGLNLDDVVLGVTAIAVPLRLSEPWRLGSLTVAGPSTSFTRKSIDSTKATLTARANEFESQTVNALASAFDLGQLAVAYSDGL
jgi:DNA-binding IclR family transcriptional regulator